MLQLLFIYVESVAIMNPSILIVKKIIWENFLSGKDKQLIFMNVAHVGKVVALQGKLYIFYQKIYNIKIFYRNLKRDK